MMEVVLKNFDKFYTKPSVSKMVLEELFKRISKDEYLFIEPSAGDGSFFKLLPDNKIGIDILPDHKDLIQADYLVCDFDISKNICVVGNPPFGKNSSLAIKFFNHSAKFANVIAFIVPRTFQKQSVHDRLDPFFELSYETLLPSNSFTFDNHDVDVQCVFQIWFRTKEHRAKSIKESSNDFSFVSSSDDHDLVVQRVGVKAGCVKTPGTWSSSSHYFIKTMNYTVMNRIKRINFDEVRLCTAGCPSISKEEIYRLYKKTP